MTFDEAMSGIGYIHKGYATVDNRDECNHLLACLTSRERRVIGEYFGGRNMADIGAALGIGCAAVSRIKQFALAKIRRLNCAA